MTGNAHDGFHPPRLSPEDERLMGRLRDLLRTADDVPEAVRAAARNAYAPGSPPAPAAGPDGGPSHTEA